MDNKCGICLNTIKIETISERYECNCNTGNDSWASGFRGYYNRCDCKTGYYGVIQESCVTCNSGVRKCRLCKIYYPYANHHTNSCKNCYKSINPSSEDLTYIFNTDKFLWQLEYMRCWMCKSMINVLNKAGITKYTVCDSCKK